MKQSTLNLVKGKFDDILSIKGLSKDLKKELIDFKKQLNNYSEKQQYLGGVPNLENLKKIIERVTGKIWEIQCFDNTINNNLEDGIEDLGLIYEDFEERFSEKQVVIYTLNRNTMSNYETCEMNIWIEGIEVSVEEFSLGASGTTFSCFVKDLEKSLKQHLQK